jgi:hypothetical protein
MSLNASDSQIRRDDNEVIRQANRRRALEQYKALLRTLTEDQLEAQQQKHQASGLQELAELARAELERRRTYPRPHKELYP